MQKIIKCSNPKCGKNITNSLSAKEVDGNKYCYECYVKVKNEATGNKS